jgi:molybdopterin-synthase adenylyltransferase
LRKPRIKRTIELIGSPDGDLYLHRPSAKTDIRIEQPSDDDRRLLDALDGTRTLAELHAEFGADAIDDTISQLGGLEAIEDAADDELIEPLERDRLESQLRYFSDIGTLELTPSECQRRLREAKVAVLGVGGLGGWAAYSLACLGIGELWLIDGDRVERSNLNRQILYTEADIGLLKVEAAARRLRAFNPTIRVTATARRLESQVELADFIADADLVVDAADWPAHEIESWCNAACFEAGIPYITMSNVLPRVRVGPLYVPGVTGCFSCQKIAYRREYPNFDSIVDQQRGKSFPAATLGPGCGIVGGQVGMEVLHQITGLAVPAALGCGLVYDLRTLEIEREAVVPEPDCPVCGHLKHAQPVARVQETAGS